ncbi:phosphodiester glycosidase family protein [Aquicoccus porphyridii]|uniref:phosphodiester glycosidase family protein n=1 Tax=Aquicoccus porphyridii TaxID=1852029 RepID=UPI00273FB915|nr:phosphodiester glycosidase family protein [Aquicoccus porphyridii]
MRRFWACLVLLLVPGIAGAVECREMRHEGNGYAVCEVDARSADIRLFLKDDADQVIGNFRALDAILAAEGRRLAIAMNAGMYHSDRSPVGLFLEGGQEVQGLITSAGPGNFGLLPNGVFCIRAGRADVIETMRFKREAPDCRDASQSGPMLVIDGKLHPRFLPDSTSRYVRNGVGTSEDGTRVVFAISNNAVTFHEFGRLFRDALNLPQALYFDGNISRLHAPALGRSDAGFPMGPIVGVVE